MTLGHLVASENMDKHTRFIFHKYRYTKKYYVFMNGAKWYLLSAHILWIHVVKNNSEIEIWIKKFNRLNEKNYSCRTLFKINTYGFGYCNDKSFSMDMSKSHDFPIIFLKRTCLLEMSKVINIFAISLTIHPFQTAGKSNSVKKISHMMYTVLPLFISVLLRYYM